MVAMRTRVLKKRRIKTLQFRMPPRFPKRVAKAYLSNISRVHGVRILDLQSWRCGKFGIPDVKVSAAVSLSLGYMENFILGYR